MTRDDWLWYRFCRIFKDRGGVAAVEFALIAPVATLLVMLTVDFAVAFNTQLRLLAGVAAGVQYIQKNGSGLTSGNFSGFTTNVTQVVTSVTGSKPVVTVAVLLNNSANATNAGNHYCVSGSPPVWTLASSGNATCSANLTAGKFVTLTVSTSLANIFPTQAALGSVFPLRETMLVRVE